MMTLIMLVLLLEVLNLVSGDHPQVQQYSIQLVQFFLVHRGIQGVIKETIMYQRFYLM